MITYVVIAVGLSMDAMAVSVTSGICMPELRRRDALRASLTFGFFQFLMPILGWFLGNALNSRVQALSHLIAFALLCSVGVKMIVESLRSRDPASCADDEIPTSILDPMSLLSLAVATSIDAFAIGVSYNLLGLPILVPSLIIGAVTFLLCLAGIEFGRRLGSAFRKWAETAGGVILILIGLAFLLQHLAGVRL
ncbi:MAG TPA: manganese efflux pump MntP family protein [Rectinemataceae bacterium]|nr:manganese efflux pump MntP family protein [Rectinemataceae bacterium]